MAAETGKLSAKKFSQHGSDNAQADDRYGAMVLLQRGDGAARRCDHVRSPADSANDGNRAHRAQQRAAGLFLWSARRPECSAIFVAFAGACAPFILITFLRHVPNLN